MTTETAPARPGEGTRPGAGPSRLRRLAETPEAGVVAACVVVFAALALTKPSFAGPVNLQGMGFDLAQYGLIAIGESLVILTGGIDLSVGALLGTGVILMSWLNVRAGLPAPLAVVIVLALTGLVGLVHGLAVTRLRMPPFVVTLVTYTVAQGVTLAVTSGTSITGISGFFGDLGQTYLAQVPVPLVIFAVVAVAAWFFLERTFAGRQVYAVGGNAEAARLAGIRGDRRVVAMYVTSSLLSGCAAVLVLGRMGVGSASGVGVGWELSAIAAAVIGGVSLVGGQGRILGIVAGTVLLELINNGLTTLQINSNYTNIVLGCVLGLAITADRLRARRVARRR
ncbi:ABC transporter permease [Streptantibioticus cattleyicolor]|uniref:Monosaccharide-transporting ATPase n=1 Tax=Streptantibioticus cattleyicolor (strain ATCC 35852 / DSM 46488 / JCM 4925 / NBRC 14057 / NRRL 8057) TaxID=1003195 RepID=F8JJB9_STREN|nr:ABC transporter permease [Streptantibioticus cattleyicolor]AEW98767.1 Monosaccharide-transporting ATPase [Streptantibioticus cattleyicolor NRRL 8057 = DSM 46488]CCB72182.1 Monosaccharide ABC transporter membrane protein, CUT2 family [Streptantibioticus cattleyicolor NRRL 8057 = DSM 46488]